MTFKIILLCMMSLFFTSCKCTRNQTADQSEQDKKRSYYIGVSLARSVDLADGFDADEVLEGFKDGLQGSSDAPSPQEIQDFLVKEQQRRYQKRNAQFIENEKQARQYLEEIAKKENLENTGEGIYFKIIKPGSGQPMNASDKIMIKIKGQLPDGTVFEDKTNKAASMTLMEAVPGLRMLSSVYKKGSQLKIYLAPQQAYGLQGRSGVPPMSAVIFDLEVTDIERQNDQKIRM